MRRFAAATFALVLLGAACGSSDDGGSSGTTASSAPASTTTTQLPGAPFDLYPYEDAVLGVVGVEAGDTLNVRTGPGVEFDVAAELEPLAEDLTATGRNRRLEGGDIWSEITVGEETGWVGTRFVSHLGKVDDITSELAAMPGGLPSAPSMEELTQLVAAARASEEPPSRLVVVDGPTVGDLGESTVDVIGLGDDSQAGERLHLFAEPVPGGGSFALRTVERTLLCSRGATAEGLCV